MSRYAGRILLFMGLLTAVAVPLASHLRLRANFMDLLPASTQSILDLKELNGHVGGSSYLIAVMESPDAETARLGAEKLAQRVGAYPEVGYVNNRTDVPAFKDRKLLFLDMKSVEKLERDVKDVIAFHRRSSNPFYFDLLKEEAPVLDMKNYTTEGKISRIGGFSSKHAGSFMQVVLIKPKHPMSDFVSSEKLFEKMRVSFEEVKTEMGGQSGLDLALTGPYKVRYDEYRTISRDLKRTGLLSAAMIGLIMIIGFRSLRSLFYIYAPIVIVMLWTCAFAFLAVGYLNLISGFLFGILLGMGIDYAIHLRIALSHHYKLLKDSAAAVEQTYAEVGRPIFTSCLTTTIAFFSLAISPFEGFRHFGIISGVGIMLSFLVVYYGMPSLMIVMERRFPPKKEEETKVHKKFRVPGPVIISVLAASLLFSAYSIYEIRNIRFDYNFANLQAKDEGIKLALRVYEHFGVELTPAAFMTKNRADAVALAAQINDYIDKTPDTTFDFAASLMSHVPGSQPEKIEILQRINALITAKEPMLSKLEGDARKKIDELKAQLGATELKWEELPEGMKRQYEDLAGNISAVYVFPKDSILDGQVAKKFVKELRAFPAPGGLRAAGEPVIYADILMLLERDSPRSMGLSLILVVAILFLHFRRPSHVLWVLTPIFLAFLWMIGMAGAAGFKFNYLNVAILPSVLGAGIDNGIYIYSSYQARRGGNFLRAIWNTGKGVILSSLTAMAAFASLIWANHEGMASVGLLGFFGFTSCFLASVIVLPALIQFKENFMVGRASRRLKARA